MCHYVYTSLTYHRIPNVCGTLAYCAITLGSAKHMYRAHSSTGTLITRGMKRMLSMVRGHLTLG